MVQTLTDIYTWFILNGPALIAAITGLLAFLEIVVRLTPTKRDDTVVNYVASMVDRLFEALKIPNRKKGGGVHPEEPAPEKVLIVEVEKPKAS